MSVPRFESRWPIEAIREQDLYFYLEVIEAYLPDCRVRVVDHGELLMLGSYSYLGLNGHPKINQAAKDAIDQYGTGAHGARLLAGTVQLHRQLEEKVAAFKGTEDAVTFTSGYLTNLSTIACLLGPKDTVIGDVLNHASIVDGCQLSGAGFVWFKHNDTDHLETCLRQAGNQNEGGRILVVADAVFSMDGDILNLPDVSALCRRYGATLMVDEAHALGVLGQTGHGIEEYFGLPPDTIDIKMGTFSKTIPSGGGYIAGSRELCEMLRHEARGFIYSGALLPAPAAAALAALEIIEDEPERVQRLQANVRFFAGLLRRAGFSAIGGMTPIFPIICGEDSKAFELARYCQKRGVYVQAIPYPVVPMGKARLRAAVSAAHKREDLTYCATVLREGALEVGGIPERLVDEVASAQVSGVNSR